MAGASGDGDVAKGCAAFVGAWLLAWPSGAIRAAVAMKGWEWFVTDTFGAPSLAFIEAWGLFLLVSFATFQVPPASDDDRSPGYLMAYAFTASVMWSALMFVSLLILSGLRP